MLQLKKGSHDSATEHICPSRHVPQLPPQSSVPQVLRVQFGVQHVPLATHTAGDVHVPQLPPQPSSPHVLPVQLGVQHVPNFFGLPPTHTFPQQLWFV